MANPETRPSTTLFSLVLGVRENTTVKFCDLRTRSEHTIYFGPNRTDYDVISDDTLEATSTIYEEHGSETLRYHRVTENSETSPTDPHEIRRNYIDLHQRFLLTLNTRHYPKL